MTELAELSETKHQNLENLAWRFGALGLPKGQGIQVWTGRCWASGAKIESLLLTATPKKKGPKALLLIIVAKILASFLYLCWCADLYCYRRLVRLLTRSRTVW